MNNDEFIRHAIKTLQPVIYLHKEENYFPIDFREYINEAKLRRKRGKKVFKEDVNLNYKIFGEWLEKYPHINSLDYTLFLPDKMKSHVIQEKITDPYYLDNVPIYVHIEEKFNEREQTEEFYISFIHMYAFNGPTKIFGCFSAGKHFADMEHVTLCVQKGRENRPVLTNMYFSRHNGGVWITPDRLLYEDGHPVVYSAYHSHASYEKPGNKYRYCKCIKDKCNKGMKWLSQNLVYLNNKETLKENAWIDFRGDLGCGNVRGFIGRNFWTDPDKSGNYGQGCCFSCC